MLEGLEGMHEGRECSGMTDTVCRSESWLMGASSCALFG